MKLNKIASAVIIVAYSLLQGNLASAYAFDQDGSVDRPEFGNGTVTTGAHDHKLGSSDNSVDQGPRPVIEFIPACQVSQTTQSGQIDRSDCDQPCEGDGSLQLKTVTTTPGQPPDVSLVCQHGPNIEALAIDEFYTNKIAVPAPTVSPGKATFANFPNIFSTPIREQTQNTGITVANVKIKFIPAFYRWDFGDDTKLDTTDPGKPYDPNLANRVDDVEKNFPVTHRFETTGQFDIRLTVTFRGAYSINAGPWQTIPGSTAATSPPHTLTVKQARGQFVSENGE